MKTPFTIGLAALALALTGCVVTSVYPFYTEKDLVFETKLLGRWSETKEPNKNETWTFSRADTNSYRLIGTDGTASNTYAGHLFKLGGQLLLDLCPAERHDDFIPPHYLVKVLQVEPTLRVSLLSQDWLEKELAANPQSVRHLKIKGQTPEEEKLVLTDTPQNLQAFVRKNLQTIEAWGDIDELSRLPAGK